MSHSLKGRNSGHFLATVGIGLIVSLSSCRRPQEIKIPDAAPLPLPQPPNAGDLNPRDPSPNPPIIGPATSGDPAPGATVDPKPPEMPAPKPTEPVTTMPEVLPKSPDPIPSPTPSPIPSPEIPRPKRYLIMGDASRRCITVPSNLIGVQVELRDCTNSENQLFKLETVAPNVMKIVAFSNYVLEIRGSLTHDLAAVETGAYEGGAWQEFVIEPKHFVNFNAINVRNTSSTLDAFYRGTENGTGIVIYRTASPAANQRWIIKVVD